MNETIENDTHAVSIYGQESPLDEFPILKAFQEYIDAEQARARKRITALAVFFGVMMIALIAIFVSLLVRSYGDNQHLNDRLVEYMQQERERSDKEHAERERMAAEAAAKPQQDSAVVLALTKKIEELQEKIYDAQRKADDAERKADDAERLRLENERKLLEKEKLIAEKNKQRQVALSRPSRSLTIGNLDTSKLPKYDKDLDEDELDLPDEDSAISYYDDEDDIPAAPAKKKVASPSKPKPAVKAPAKQAPKASPEKKYAIPVEVKKSDISVWDIPEF